MSYKLSTELVGHSNDVRVVSSCKLGSDNAIITASRDGTVLVWVKKESSLDYDVTRTLKGHKGAATAICVIPPEQNTEKGTTLVVTGGQDSKLLVHDLVSDDPIELLEGHEKYVSSIIHFAGVLISTSWDCTLRVWDANRRHVLCHSPAAYVVCGVPGPDASFVLTGGADKLVKLWQISSLSCVQEYRGHEDVVRDIKAVSSELFLSAANDCTVRQWSVHSAECLLVFCAHEAYVYSCSMFPGGGGSQFASCGEDGTVRLWKDGSCEQTVSIPATSVWSVHCLENGDFVVGSSDYKARIFTAVQEREASAEKLRKFSQEVDQQKLVPANQDAIDVSKLPGEDVLQKPGKKDGEKKLVRVGDKAEVHQWNEAELQWDKIGDALGQAPPKIQPPNMYQGKEYDFVFDIELDDGKTNGMSTLKLPYNKTDDPWHAANKFLDDNMLPQVYLDQVAQFIIQNSGGAAVQTGSSLPILDSDPLTAPSRYIPSSSSASANAFGAQQYQQPTAPTANPYFPMLSYKKFLSPEDYFEKVMQKLKEFNSQLDQVQTYQLTDSEVSSLMCLCKDLLREEWDEVTLSHKLIIDKLLSWPSEYCFPGLDIVRLMVLKSSGSKCLMADKLSGDQFLQKMNEFICGMGAQSKNQAVVLRVFANLFATLCGEELMHESFFWVNGKVEEIYSSDNRNCQIALATVFLNYCHYYSKNESEFALSSLVIDLTRILQSKFDSEAKYRSMIGIGILVCSSKMVRETLLASNAISGLRLVSTASGHAKLMECTDAVVKELGRTEN